MRAAVSVPGIFLSQIANLHTLEARGLDSGKAAGVIGHSQGILGRYLMREPQHAAELLALAELIGAAATSFALSRAPSAKASRRLLIQSKPCPEKQRAKGLLCSCSSGRFCSAMMSLP